MEADSGWKYARQILEHAPVGITVAELGVEPPAIVYANERFGELTGYRVSEILDRGACFFRGENTRKKRVEQLRAAIEDGQRTSLELRGYRKDGSTFWNRVRTAPLGESGCVCFHEDVTDRRAQRAALERQNEQLESFAGTISHDLRNPLNIAMTRIDLAQQSGDEAHLEEATDALERMQTLIETVLELSREGEQAQITRVALDKVAGEAWETTETAEATLGVEVNAEIAANESRLRQLFENVFDNAVCHGGGDVHVEVGPLEPVGPTTGTGEQQLGGFYVADDGAGLPTTVVDDQTAVTTISDDGLGLEIVAEIAAEHNWELYATESANGGARFEFEGVETIRTG